MASRRSARSASCKKKQHEDTNSEFLITGIEIKKIMEELMLKMKEKDEQIAQLNKELELIKNLVMNIYPDTRQARTEKKHTKDPVHDNDKIILSPKSLMTSISSNQVKKKLATRKRIFHEFQDDESRSISTTAHNNSFIIPDS